MTPMISAFDAPTIYSSSFEKMVDLLPRIMALPGGIIYANYLIFRGTRLVRRCLNLAKLFSEKPKFLKAGPEIHQEYAQMVAEAAEGFRRVSAPLFSLGATNIITKLLLARLEKVINEYSDLADTWTLRTDPEMQQFAAELNDVL